MSIEAELLSVIAGLLTTGFCAFKSIQYTRSGNMFESGALFYTILSLTAGGCVNIVTINLLNYIYPPPKRDW